MFLEDQITKVWPLLLLRRYFAIWLLVRAHRGRLLSPYDESHVAVVGIRERASSLLSLRLFYQ